MATLREVQQRVDDWLASKWSDFLSLQQSYEAANGRYWQGLPIHDSDPIDGADTTPNRRDVKPSGQAEDWSTFVGNRFDSVRCNLRCDVYDGPQGKGFVVTVRAGWQDRSGVGIYERSVNHGAETHRTTDWFEVIEREEP